MSLSDDEALFDDIYGDDAAPVKPEAPKSVAETTSGDSKKDEDVRDAEPKAEGDEAETTPAIDLKEGEAASTKDDDLNSTEKTEHLSTTAESIVPASQVTTSPVPLSDAESERKADLSRDAAKMFIGGLDWDTNEDAMKEYFSQFGEVIDHTIMRESSTGRSRGFGFLTFADPKSVDKVVRQQHVLDGKVIDPKRAIPRDEQDKTGKIFVGGLPPEVRPHEFEEFFSKFGSIIDAQLMLDKDTGRSRGFGFVTFDSPDSVDKATERRFIDFKGKQIEVKRAEPRGQQQQQNHIQQQQQRFMNQQSQNMGTMNMGMMGAMAGVYQQQQMQQQMQQVSPEQLSQYITSMEQYWTQVKQTQQVTPEQEVQFKNWLDGLRQQQSSLASRPPAPAAPASYGQNFGIPRGPSNNSGNGIRRNRGGHNRRGGYHPYSRD